VMCRVTAPLRHQIRLGRMDSVTLHAASPCQTASGSAHSHAGKMRRGEKGKYGECISALAPEISSPLCHSLDPDQVSRK
jgi:hypothetical protein